jgi:hypothetical protein
VTIFLSVIGMTPIGDIARQNPTITGMGCFLEPLDA